MENDVEGGKPLELEEVRSAGVPRQLRRLEVDGDGRFDEGLPPALVGDHGDAALLFAEVKREFNATVVFRWPRWPMWGFLAGLLFFPAALVVSIVLRTHLKENTGTDWVISGGAFLAGTYGLYALPIGLIVVSVWRLVDLFVKRSRAIDGSLAAANQGLEQSHGLHLRLEEPAEGEPCRMLVIDYFATDAYQQQALAVHHHQQQQLSIALHDGQMKLDGRVPFLLRDCVSPQDWAPAVATCLAAAKAKNQLFLGWVVMPFPLLGMMMAMPLLWVDQNILHYVALGISSAWIPFGIANIMFCLYRQFDAAKERRAVVAHLNAKYFESDGIRFRVGTQTGKHGPEETNTIIIEFTPPLPPPGLVGSDAK